MYCRLRVVVYKFVIMASQEKNCLNEKSVSDVLSGKTRSSVVFTSGAIIPSAPTSLLKMNVMFPLFAPATYALRSNDVKYESHLVTVSDSNTGWMVVKLVGNTPLALVAQKPTMPLWPPGVILKIYATVHLDVKKQSYLFIHSFYSRAQRESKFAAAVNFYATRQRKTIDFWFGSFLVMFNGSKTISRWKFESEFLSRTEASGAKFEETKANPQLPLYYMSIGFMFPNPPSSIFALMGRVSLYKKVNGKTKK